MPAERSMNHEHFPADTCLDCKRSRSTSAFLEGILVELRSRVQRLSLVVRGLGVSSLTRNGGIPI